MKKVKQLLLVTMSAALFMLPSGCSKKDKSEEQKKFDDFMQQEFVKDMTDNYLNTHIYLEHPEKYGIDKSKIKVQIDVLASEENFDKARKKMEESKKQFTSIDRDSLSDEQKEAYDIYKARLESDIAQSKKKYDYIAPVFGTMTGLHTQLPTLFTDLTLRNEQDVKDAVTLMKSVRPYVASLIDYTKKQEAKGTLMIDTKGVKEYCQKVVDEKDKTSVLTGLNESIDELKLGKEKTDNYKAEIKAAYMSAFLPAYEDIIKAMDNIDPSKNNAMGLSHMKDGKSYYELAFKDASGSDKSIEDIKKDLNALAQKSLFSAQSVVMNNKQAYEDFSNGKLTTKYTDFKSMLKDLSGDIKDDFPSVGNLKYNIEPIGEDIASGGVAAYFNLPALDSTKPDQIRVNMRKNALKINSMDTFSTVAHEGIPGHMYQVNYVNKNIKEPWRKTSANFSGYTEGYATYVELYSLKYLKDVSAEGVKLQQSMTTYQDCIIALSDIGIHYEGWTKNEFKQFLQDNGLEATSSDELYVQLQANPTAFIPYYVGYMQFANLRTKAEDALKDKFKDKDFHEAILRSGYAPFSVVEKNVDAYIKKAK